jgi:hypothetical protein
MCIESVTDSSHLCPCGCGNTFPVYSGRVRYGADLSASFSVAHILHCPDGATAWLHLRSGSWFDDDDRNCWVTMQLFADSENVVTTIRDPESSPLWPSRDHSERYLSRAEVLAQNGGKEWAINCRLGIEEHHAPTQQFLRGGGA